jgi:hypothetical protein
LPCLHHIVERPDGIRQIVQEILFLPQTKIPTSRKEREKWGTRRREIDKVRRVFLLLAHLSGDVVAELLLDLLLGLGIEVGHIEQPTDFDHHFVIRAGDA